MLWSADKYRKWHSYFIVRIISHVFAAISQNDPMIVCETPSNSYWKKRNKRTVRNDRNHQKRIETMQTKKSPNDNVSDSNAERNALLDLDLTCWIILSANFQWNISMKVKTTEEVLASCWIQRKRPTKSRTNLSACGRKKKFLHMHFFWAVCFVIR